MSAKDSAWWRDAVIYQVYPRSFADSDGDGVGDINGIRARLGHLRDLGVDAIWMSPWYPSPMADAGYDVADFRDVDPVFGTLAGAEALIAEAHAAGIRMIVDIVPNHISAEHPWFRAAIAAPDAPERDYFWFRPPSERMPTGWTGEFGGTTWTKAPDGSWYLHLFTPEQPDLNWEHPDVQAEFEDILRFWFDRGADGIRIDSAALLFKDTTLPEVEEGRPHPFHDLDAVHDVYRAWRRVADDYEGRALIGEVWMPDVERFTNYLRPDELHAAFNFDFLGCAWDPALLRSCIDRTLDAHVKVGAPATWVLSNHDVTRHVTRYGRTDTTFSFENNLDGTPVDLELGTRRARAAALLSLSLPGATYVYQGEELGLWENENIPEEQIQDPMYGRRGHTRDGCRVPLPWSGDEPPFGFSSTDPWLPQPAEWKDRTVAAQTGDPNSMLELYRSAIRLRGEHLDDPAMTWFDHGDDVLAYHRGADFACLLNLSGAPVRLPEHQTILLASGPLDGDLLPRDTAIWLRL
ncbi:alpha-glucosidase [Actinoplanes sp. SE50]|uniref:glycoside hydrolase family 13 protein n=1 Tax=unclassified Actinoplanes TaxID=2626549 RepID=UPI00023ECBE0|nr:MULTISPECIES: glycoside hydrolase family 13 protein [unclassified Actinoplanes]AEV87720.1 alpha amylase catalytic region [Actinoplanes sp. SE50/110]ATO86123.1 alpha-glucosidase [Actinoplanes sp. SE50]SLM03537.1 alpha-glucosidase [Actinoplanes sp. SE50/110]